MRNFANGRIHRVARPHNIFYNIGMVRLSFIRKIICNVVDRLTVRTAAAVFN